MSNRLFVCLFEALIVPVNKFSFWNGFLGLTSTNGNGDEMSCSRTQHQKELLTFGLLVVREFNLVCCFDVSSHHANMSV